MNSQDTLGSALEAFIREHEYCGELDTGLEGDRVWMRCTCGAVIVRTPEPSQPMPPRSWS
jgi:proteasome lid subunit RPN8/RPN11